MRGDNRRVRFAQEGPSSSVRAVAAAATATAAAATATATAAAGSQGGHTKLQTSKIENFHKYTVGQEFKKGCQENKQYKGWFVIDVTICEGPSLVITIADPRQDDDAESYQAEAGKAASRTNSIFSKIEEGYDANSELDRLIESMIELAFNYHRSLTIGGGKVVSAAGKYSPKMHYKMCSLLAAKSALSEYTKSECSGKCIHHIFELIANLIAVMQYKVEEAGVFTSVFSPSASAIPVQADQLITDFMVNIRIHAKDFIGSVVISEMIVKAEAALDFGFSKPVQTLTQARGNGFKLPEAVARPAITKPSAVIRNFSPGNPFTAARGMGAPAASAPAPAPAPAAPESAPAPAPAAPHAGGAFFANSFTERRRSGSHPAAGSAVDSEVRARERQRMIGR